MYLNKVLLAGHLTRDVELKYTEAGTAIAHFGVAVSRKWKDKDGEQKEEVCFVDCNAFARTAEVICEFMVKGSPILIEGRLRFNQWETTDGQKRSTLRVVVESFQFVPDGKGKDA